MFCRVSCAGNPGFTIVEMPEPKIDGNSEIGANKGAKPEEVLCHALTANDQYIVF